MKKRRKEGGMERGRKERLPLLITKITQGIVVMGNKITTTLSKTVKRDSVNITTYLT